MPRQRFEADEYPSLLPTSVSVGQRTQPQQQLPGTSGRGEGNVPACILLAGEAYCTAAIKLPGFSSALLAEFISYPYCWKNKQACELEISINTAVQCRAEQAARSSRRGKELKDILCSVQLALDIKQGIRHDTKL